MAHPRPLTDEREDRRPRPDRGGTPLDGAITRCEWCGAEYPVPPGDAAPGAGCGHRDRPAPPATTGPVRESVRPAPAAAPSEERDMDEHELIRRTAWQAGTTEDEAGRLVEAFLHELRRGVEDGEVVSLGGFGTFRGPGFTPGPALLERTEAPLCALDAYDRGTAPSDS
jgi:hypothetical protein